MDRGRITIPDVAYVLVAVVVLAALLPPFMSVLNGNGGALPRGDQLLWLVMPPSLVLVMLTMLFVKAVGGR